MTKNKLKKYARLIIKIGVNIQENQLLVINSPVDCSEFTRLLVEEAYLAKAKNVIVRWSDDIINKSYFTYVSDEVIKEIPDYVVSQFSYIVQEGAAVISIAAPTPEILKNVDPKKLQLNTLVTHQKIGFYKEHMMGNKSQWCVVAYPTFAWAKKVFPKLSPKKAYNALLNKILEASRVTDTNDPVHDWEEHIMTLARHNKKLNEDNYKTLHFKNSLGTDLVVGLVKDHIWAGGAEKAKNGVIFCPNIPTEETFTMPHKYQVEGKVVATKPLNYQGKLIEDFYLVFKEGKVVEYKAGKEELALKNLLELDEGSSRLGEVALISDNSPISNTNILFFNTLFDENASCHLALGNAYTMNIKNGTSLSEEELAALGYNKSLTHVDFMFGSPDMEIIGHKYDGTKVIIFKNGNFIF